MKSIQDAIESLHAKDLCPRLHVDVTHADAVCPDFVRDKWKQQLVIDLDPSYPLDLAFTEAGVEADLSFAGYVTRCMFPWSAIYVVADRDSGRGQVFASNIPASLRHKFGPPVPQAPALDRELTEVRDDLNAKKGSRRRRRRGAGSSPREAVRVLESVSAGEGESEAPNEAEPSSTEQTAQTRRSAFKVIDGGS